MIQLFAPHATDFYKTGHIYQYPPGTTRVYANLTARSGRLAPKGTVDTSHIVWFGLQLFIKDFMMNDWEDSFFSRPKEEVVRRYQRRMDNALGTGVVNAKHIGELHDLGYLPLHIKSLPEGSLVPYKVAPLTITNTHDDFAWLVLYIESALSSYLWKICTTATTAYNFRKILNIYCDATGASKDAARFQIHDFAFRGLSGPADGAISAIGHLLSSAGSDTILAIDTVEDYYGANSDRELVAGGVPATEHSVMCMGGVESELSTFRRLIKDTYPTGIVSIVSDTWDYWGLITNGLKELKPDIMSRGKCKLGFCKTVIRPDSGDPVRIIAGYLDSELYIEDNTVAAFSDATYRVASTGEVITQNERKGSIQLLWELFGGTTNAKGYRDLDEHIGLIYGDSITLDRMETILKILMEKGFSANNVVFGVGSYSYQYVSRDTHGFAMKATWGVVNGEERELFKNPKTDSGVKKSARGLIAVHYIDGEFVQDDGCTKLQESMGELRSVFYNGGLVMETSLAVARERLGVF